MDNELPDNLDELYTRLLFVRKTIEDIGMTKELMLRQSELCFAIYYAMVALEEKEESKSHE